MGHVRCGGAASAEKDRHERCRCSIALVLQILFVIACSDEQYGQRPLEHRIRLNLDSVILNIMLRKLPS